MSTLWQTNGVEDWQLHLQNVKSRVTALEKPRMEELDRWWNEELPAILHVRDQCYLDKEDVVKLVDWKLTRGKWRPKLLQYAKDASDEAVTATTKKVFASLRTAAEPAMQHVEEALKELTSLKGIGPATASAMLTAVCPSLPFMSDEALAAALHGPPEYTVKKYIQLVDALRNKAAMLSKASDTSWTAAQVERALWSEALAKQILKQEAKGTKRKR